MTRFNQRFLRTALASALILVGSALPGVAGDEDIFSTQIAPNVVLMVDNSGSMNAIMEHADRNNIAVIEDCAHAYGARYQGRNIGTIGAMSCWSLQQSKILTAAGEARTLIQWHGEFAGEPGADLEQMATALTGSYTGCRLYTSPSPRDATLTRKPSSA